LRPPAQVVRLDTALVFLAVFFVLAAVAFGKPMAFDGHVMYAVAVAITHGRLHLVAGEWPFLVRPTGDFAAQFPYSHYGIGASLVMLPLYGISRVFQLSQASTFLVVLLTNPLLIAAAAAVLYRIGLALMWPRRLAIAVALAFGLLTMMAQDSSELFSEPGVALGIGVLLLGLLRWREGKGGSGLLAGTGLGIAILFRDESVFLVAPALVGAVFLVDRQKLLPRLRRQAVGFLVPLVPVLLWTTYYSHLSSGSWLPHSYGGSFDSPFWTGFYGQLIGPNVGFFFFNPWLLLAIPGVWLLGRRNLAFAAVLVGLFLARILFYARWNYWMGGVAWGPRFVVPAILPMCLLAGESLRALPRLISNTRLLIGAILCAAIFVWSGLVTVASIWVSYTTDFPHETRGWHDHLFVASKSEWWLALKHLGDPSTLHYFGASPLPVGVVLLVGAAVCIAASLARPIVMTSRSTRMRGPAGHGSSRPIPLR
jgi:hypothetical protein